MSEREYQGALRILSARRKKLRSMELRLAQGTFLRRKIESERERLFEILDNPSNFRGLLDPFVGNRIRALGLALTNCQREIDQITEVLCRERLAIRVLEPIVEAEKHAQLARREKAELESILETAFASETQASIKLRFG